MLGGGGGGGAGGGGGGGAIGSWKKVDNFYPIVEKMIHVPTGWHISSILDFPCQAILQCLYAQ